MKNIFRHFHRKSLRNGKFENLKLIQSDRISEVENIEEASNTILEYLTLQDIKDYHGGGWKLARNLASIPIGVNLTGLGMKKLLL